MTTTEIRRRLPVRAIRAQRGIALAIVLILLVVITLLALAAMRGTVLEQRMSSSVSDRGLAFQAAEAALREGEAEAGDNPRNKAGFPADGTCGTDEWQGYCGRPSATASARWLDANWEANSREATAAVEGVGAQPRYMVELLQSGLPATGSCTTDLDVSPDAQCTGDEAIYRITARSAAADRADVTLQSTYVVP
jgi:type IV pilus assembly protein PilX